jgi:hypothetical protein
MTSILMFGRSLDSSRRITSGYVAADECTQSPTVEDEPIATIVTFSPDFIRAAVRGNDAPNERSGFAARHLSAAGAPSCASVEPVAPTNIRVPKNAITAVRYIAFETLHVEGLIPTRNTGLIPPIDETILTPLSIDNHGR